MIETVATASRNHDDSHPRPGGSRRQIAIDFTEKITDGTLPPGAVLPAETRLAQKYGVSRTTVRQAFADLLSQGLITTSQGRRATVTAAPVRYSLDEKVGASLTSAMAHSGHVVTYDRIQTERGAHPPRSLVSERPLRQWTCYRYRRLVDGEPWSLSTTWIVSESAPADWDGSDAVLDAAMRTHGFTAHRVTRMFAATAVTLEQADELDTRIGAPLLRVSGTSAGDDGQVVAAVRHLVRGDRAEYAIDLDHTHGE